MAHFGSRSTKNIQSADYKLQCLARSVIEENNAIDHSVTCGHRAESEQNEAYKRGNSQAKWGESAHNSMPSNAIDVQPYPVNWDDIPEFVRLRERYFYYAGVLGIKLKPMVIFSDNTGDYPHIELDESEYQ